MKKFLLFSLAILFFSYTFGQSQRYVVFEEFTNASCGPCASQNPAFQSLMNANVSKCTYITYHWNFPGANDPMYLANPTDMQARIGYYGFNFVPSCVMDGVTIPNCSGGYAGAPACINQGMINTEYAVPAPFDLYINQQLSPGNDSLYVLVKGVCTSSVSGNLLCHLVVVEKHIHYNTPPGTNGEKDFYNVMRKMMPSSAGTPLATSFDPGDYFIYKLGWKLANITSLNELNVIGFVQNVTTKTVHQAAVTTAVPITVNANDVEVSHLNGMLPTYCVNSLSPSVTIRNTGSQPLTSLNFHYYVNSGAEVNFPWTGSLGFLESETVQLPACSFSLQNSNLLTLYTEGTNGNDDEYPGNDTITASFNAAIQAGTSATLILKTDNYPEQTTWDIKDYAGNVISSGGPYTEKLHTYNVDIPLGFGTCYQFNIYDSGNNGICCGTSGVGRYQLKSGTTIICGGASFGSVESTQFYSASGVGTEENIAGFIFNVYPNPAHGQATLVFRLATTSTVEIILTNLQGTEVVNLPETKYSPGSHESLLNLGNLSSGVYNVQLNVDGKLYNQKLTVK